MSKNKTDQQFHFHDVFGKEVNCDRSDALFQYFESLLSENEREEFEDHLSSCDSCTRLLAELQEAEAVVENTVLDSTKADRIFRENRAKLQKQLNEKYRIATLRAPWTFRVPAYMNAVMILLIAMLVYPAYRGVILEQQVTQLKGELSLESARTRQKLAKDQPPQQDGLSTEPVASPSLLYPVRVERDAEDKTISVRFETNKTFTLLFSLPPEDFQNYFVEITRENQTMWQSQTPAVGEESSKLISVHLNEEYFQEGKYDLKISGSRRQTRIGLTQYRLIISKRN